MDSNASSNLRPPSDSEDFAMESSDDWHLELSESLESDGLESTSWEDGEIAASSSLVDWDENERQEEGQGQVQDQEPTTMADMAVELRSLKEQLAGMQRMILELHTAIMTRTRSVQPSSVVDEVPGDNARVKIGGTNNSILLDKAKFHEAFKRAASGKSLFLKLLAMAFPGDELARYTVNGDRSHNLAALLEEERFQAIHQQVAKTFPNFDSASNGRLFREAINGKCRKLRAKLRNPSTP